MGKGIVFAGLAFELVALCFGGYIVGGYLDAYFGWRGEGATYTVLILLIGWFVHLIVLLRRFQKDMDDEPDPKP